MPDTNPKVVTIRPLTNLVGQFWFDNSQVDRPITVPYNVRVQEALDNGRAELIEMKQSEDGEPVFPDDFRQFFGDNKEVAQWYDGTTDEMVVGDPASGSAYVRYPADSTTPHFDTLSAGEVELNGTARTSWPSGAFSDSDGDGTYSLPNVADGISVGSVDTTSMQADAVSIANELSLPTFDDVSNAPATDGVIIYVTGDGATTPEGLYQRQSGTYVHINESAFSGDHADLTNVTSDQHHEWPVSESGLSFDPATQSELDAHDHTGDTISPDSVTSTSVQTEQLVDAVDGGTWETLKLAGYEAGDVVPLTDFGVGGQRQFSTSSTSWQGAYDQQQVILTWDDIFPASATPMVYYSVQIANTPGESRLWNQSDGEVMVGPLTRDTEKNQSSGWVEYAPTDTSLPTEIFPQHQSTDGTSVNFNAPTLMLGVKL